MQRVLDVVRENIWLRVGILGVLIAIAIWFMLPYGDRQVIQLKLAGYLGPPLIASLVLGGGTWWVTYKQKIALWTAGWAFVVVAILIAMANK